MAQVKMAQEKNGTSAKLGKNGTFIIKSVFGAYNLTLYRLCMWDL